MAGATRVSAILKKHYATHKSIDTLTQLNNDAVQDKDIDCLDGSHNPSIVLDDERRLRRLSSGALRAVCL